jgi:hypothetical protein
MIPGVKQKVWLKPGIGISGNVVPNKRNEMNINDIYIQLKDALKAEIIRHDLADKRIDIKCKPLSVEEAIGSPDHDDYPIVKGKEVMMAATFNGAVGQSFTDEYTDISLSVDGLLELDHTKTNERAIFIAGLNAVYRSLQLCEKTIHCKDKEPVACAKNLIEQPQFSGKKMLLAGLQPRFLEYLAEQNTMRALDLDPDNVGTEKFGVRIESGENFEDGLDWCDMIFATGSTIVNGTITHFLNCGKPAVFFGVTISAPAKILGLSSYCHCGH